MLSHNQNLVEVPDPGCSTRRACDFCELDASPEVFVLTDDSRSHVENTVSSEGGGQTPGQGALSTSGAA